MVTTQANISGTEHMEHVLANCPRHHVKHLNASSHLNPTKTCERNSVTISILHNGKSKFGDFKSYSHHSKRGIHYIDTLYLVQL